MKQPLWFIVPLLITIALFCYPYYETRGAPAHDGNTVIGYPLTAYSFGGGKCTSGACPPNRYPANIFIDLILLLGGPFAVHNIARKMSAH